MVAHGCSAYKKNIYIGKQEQNMRREAFVHDSATTDRKSKHKENRKVNKLEVALGIAQTNELMWKELSV